MGLKTYHRMRLLTKGLIFIILFQFTCIPLQLSARTGGSNESLEWELVTESYGIKVYERWVETESKLKVRERSGNMTLHCSVEEVLALISDLTKVALWMGNVEAVEMLKNVNEKEWYQRIVLDAPWPFKKQDMVSRYIVHHKTGDTKATVTILKETELYPKQEGIDRLDSFNARWEVEEVNVNKVKVTFTTMSTKPPQYPCWVQDPLIRNMFFSNLKNFKKLIANKQSS